GCGGRPAARVDRVEQELERAVRLRAERDLRSEDERLALADGRFERGRASLEVVLPPGPAAAERALGIEPHHRSYAAGGGIRMQPEDGAVVEIHVDVVRGPGSRRGGLVDGDAEDRSRHVVLVGTQLALGLARLAFD